MSASTETKFAYLLGSKHTSKPQNVGAEKIYLSRPEALVTTTLSELAEYLKAGHTICPGILKGGMAASNWTSQQLFLTDHDNGLTVEQALERCRSHTILPDLAYYTFRSTPDVPKFRLCFLFDEPVTNEDDRKLIVDYLFSIFPEADKSCKDACRIFFGAGKMGVVECFQELQS